MRESDFLEHREALDKVGMNYYAFDKNGVVIVAIHESVLEKWLSKKQEITADKSTIPVKKGKSKAPTTSRSTLHKIARKVSQESPQEPPKGKKRSHDIE